MTIHFVGDTHFYHGNVIWYCNRPFVDKQLFLLKTDYEEAKKTKSSNFTLIQRTYQHALEIAAGRMNEHLIEEWNKKVQPGDTVYHLGDFFFCDEEKGLKILNRLNGNITLIYGNHDKPIRRSKALQSRFNECVDYKEIYVPDNTHEKGKQFIVMSHYAMLVWNKSHHGSWMIHGHSHGGLKYPYQGKIYDAGVDVHNYAPVSYEEMRRIMSKKVTQPVDHHL